MGCRMPRWGWTRKSTLGNWLKLLVIAVTLPERPCTTRSSIHGLDVAQPPLDLRGGVCLPVCARAGHLRSGQRLRYTVCAAGVRGVIPPSAFAGIDVIQAAKLRLRVEAERRHHVVGDGLRGARVR